MRAHLSLFGKWPLSYLGTFDSSKKFFSGGLILAAITMLLFTIYLAQAYALTRRVLLVLLIGQIGQVIAAIAPYGGTQPAKTIHTVAAMILAFSIPIFLWLFAYAQPTGALRILATRLAWLVTGCFVIGIGGFLFLIKGAPVGQILTALPFHLWLIILTFHKPISPPK